MGFPKDKVKQNKIGKLRNKSGIERVVNASAATLIRGLQQRLKEKPSGTDVPQLITKTGTGTDTRYAVEHANISN